MKIDIVDRLAAFEALRANWNGVYAADPEANVFLSWDWMSKWLQAEEDQWLILAAKPTATSRDYVGFFPLRVNTKPAKSGGFFTEIAMASGNFADYTGFIVQPASADAAIDAFGRQIKAMSWAIARFSRMRLRDGHHDRLIGAFPRSKFDVLLNYPMKDSVGIDNSICPYAPLPDTWDRYLSGLSANTRQHLRRLLRQVEADPELRIAHAGSQNIERMIETLIELWGQKWSARKGENIGPMQRVLRAKLRDYYSLGILYMPVLLHGEQPVGLHACLLDGEKRTMHFFIGAREESYDNPQPGLTLHAHSIRHAIEMGLTRYDFMRGNERYKYSFGAVDRRISNTIVRVKPGASPRKLFDVRSVSRALRLIREQKAAGKQADIEIGYRQILEVDRDCTAAVVGFAELQAARGRIMAAEKLLRDFVARHDSSEAAWLALGQCLAAQHCWPEAEACFLRGLELNPQLAEAHYRIGLMYEMRGNIEEARRSYKKVLEIDPDYRDVKQRLIDIVLRPTYRQGQVVDPSKANTP